MYGFGVKPNENMRVLIVDDEADVANGLARGLTEVGMTTDVAHTAEEALLLTGATLPYTVAILDVMLGGTIDGVEVCRRLRKQGVATSILMLTARDDIVDRLKGFDAGADDYLAKPFHFDEVLARVRALERRFTEFQPSSAREIGNVKLLGPQLMVTVDGAELVLTRREFEVFDLFFGHPNQILQKAQIHQAIWGVSETDDSGLVDAYASRIRRKLSKAGAQLTIENRRGVGYVLREIRQGRSN